MAVEDTLPTLTIEQLAQQTGMTVRNIRAYQTNGLLPSPARRGRSSYYGDEHVARLELINDLRRQGFGLDAIQRIFERAPSTSWRELSRYVHSLTKGFFVDEAPALVPGEVLAAKWPRQLTRALVERTLQLGLIRRHDNGMFEVLSPTLEEVGGELARLGISLEVALDVQEALLQHVRAIAQVYVALVVDHVWRPLLQQSNSTLPLDELIAAMARMRPLATTSVAAAFPIVLQQEFEAFLSGKHERSLSNLPPTD